MKCIGNGLAALPAALMLFLAGAAATAAADPSPADSITPPSAAAAPASDPAKDSATAPAQTPAYGAALAAPVPVPASPIVEAVRTKLSDKAAVSKANAEQVEALKAFYVAHSDPIWLKDGAFSGKAGAAISEIKNAESYGLDASAFALPELTSGASTDAQADAEIKLDIAALKYAQFARGGRVDPVSLSNILDMKPPLKDPKTVLTELSDSAAPDAYLRGLHPKHPQFEKLRQALEKARGPQTEEKIDEALKIKLPEGKTVKPGDEHADIVLLRKRLKIEAQSASNQKLFDAKLEVAVKTFQEANELKANGQLNAKTRSALNREGEPKNAEPKRDVERIIVNMERWRWLPEDLGPFYVMNNIPEYVSRVMKGETEVLKQKIIVGQPTWPTPVLTASMEFVIFHPEWGVPDGIKVKELLPRLKRASSQYGGNGFFDQLFGGGSGGGARVLAAYKLNPTLNGRPVDANTIDWNRVDIKQFSFVQPAGGENPLGLVKFRFPNRHEVYMHDTPQKGLFAQSFRALSHGCMRLDQPRKLAEVILGEDKGWSSDKVGGLYASGTSEIALTKQVPVYLTYFTARVGDDGKIEKFGDIYGHDERLMSALQGRSVHYDAPNHSDEVASADDRGDAPLTPSSKKQSGKKGAYRQKREAYTTGNILSDALNGLLAN